MALTVAQFRASMPDFAKAPDDLIAAKLAEAELRTPIVVWGDLQPSGVLYLAAHLLSLSQAGRGLAKADGALTYYDTERKRLEAIVSSGYRRTL